MAGKVADRPAVLAPRFRVIWPKLFVPELNKLSAKGQMEYTVQGIFDAGANLTALREDAKAACAAKWGDNPGKWPKNMRNPFNKTEDKMYENDSGERIYPSGMKAGGIVMTFKSYPKKEGGRWFKIYNEQTQEIIDPSEVYAGCYAAAMVSAFAYGGPGISPGVSFWLKSFKKVGEGDPLGSGTRHADDFAAIEGAGPGMTAEAASADSLFN